MDQIRLSPRLAAIAALIPAGARVVDVGTDHGYLPVWLIQAGICDRVLATDIKRGPLQQAAAAAEQYHVGTRLELLLCDGLAGCSAEDVDTVIVAGMGGETIAGILERAPWTVQDRLMILQPMSKAEELRRWLAANGYRILQEELVKDGGTIYPILTARGGREDRPLSAAELYIGKWELISQDPLLRQYLDLAQAKLCRAVAGLEQSVRPVDLPRLEEKRVLLAELDEMQRRLLCQR